MASGARDRSSPSSSVRRGLALAALLVWLGSLVDAARSREPSMAWLVGALPLLLVPVVAAVAMFRDERVAGRMCVGLAIGWLSVPLAGLMVQPSTPLLPGSGITAADALLLAAGLWVLAVRREGAREAAVAGDPHGLSFIVAIAGAVVLARYGATDWGRMLPVPIAAILAARVGAIAALGGARVTARGRRAGASGLLVGGAIAIAIAGSALASRVCVVGSRLDGIVGWPVYGSLRSPCVDPSPELELAIALAATGVATCVAAAVIGGGNGRQLR